MKKIIRSFIRMDVAIFIFVFLIIGSVIGTILLQNQPNEFYQGRYGIFWGDLLLTLSFNNTYASLWYQFFLILLMFSLVCCLIINGKVIFKAMFKPITIDYKKLKEGTKLDFDKQDDFDKYVAKNKMTCEDIKSYNHQIIKRNSVLAIAYKNKVPYKLGYFGTHIGVLLICVAGIITGFFGFKSDMDLIENKEYSKSVIYEKNKAEYFVKLPFIVKSEGLIVDRFSSNMVQSYTTNIQILDKNTKKVIKSHQLKVNSPLFINNFGIYQSSVYENIKNIKVDIFNLNNQKSNVLDLKLNTASKIKDSTYSIKVTRFNKNTLVPSPDITTRYKEIDLGESIEYEISSPATQSIRYRVYLDHKDLLGVGFLDKKNNIAYQSIPTALDSNNKSLIELFSLMLKKDTHNLFKTNLNNYLKEEGVNKSEVIAKLIHAEKVYQNIENKFIINILDINYDDVSGIQVNYDPSAKVFFIASILLSLGVILMLYYRPVRLVLIDDKGVITGYEY